MARKCGLRLYRMNGWSRIYAETKAWNPARWSGATRNWSPIEEVWLDPERESAKKLTLA